MRIAAAVIVVVLIALGSVLIPWACGYTEPAPTDPIEKTVVVEKTVPVEKTIEVLPDTGGYFSDIWVGASNAPLRWFEPVGAVLIATGVILASRNRFK